MVESVLKTSLVLEKCKEEYQINEANDLIKDVYKVVQYEDKSVYRGNIVDGKRQGRGKHVKKRSIYI